VKRSRQTEWWQNLALLVGSVVVFLLVLEVAVRVALPGKVQGWPPGLFVEDDALGYKLATKFSGLQRSQEFDVAVTTDADGWRFDGQQAVPSSATANHSILLLGDSFLFGWGVPWQQSFASRLQEQVPPGWQVVSRGVPGYSTIQERLVMEQEIADGMVPDITLVLFVIDTDLWDNAAFNATGPAGYYFYRGQMFHSPLTLMNKLRALLYEKSESYVYFGRLARNSALGRKLLDKGGARSSLSILQMDESDAHWQQTLAELTAMREEAAMRGSVFGIVFVPTKLQVYPSLLEQAQQAYGLTGHYDRTLPQRILSDWAARENALFIDPMQELSGDRSNYFVADGHWTSTGHAIGASAVGKNLKSSGLLR